MQRGAGAQQLLHPPGVAAALLGRTGPGRLLSVREATR